MKKRFRFFQGIVICIIACGVSMFPMVLRAADPLFTVYNSDDGLPGNNVYCAMQDRDGFLWFGTDGGVSRFDGTNFRNFSMDQGLCDNEILRIAQDSKGRIWFLSLSGCLAYYDGIQIHSSVDDEALRLQLNTLGTFGLFEDSKGNLWFYGLDDDVVMYDNKKAHLIRADVNSYEGQIRPGVHIYEDNEGEIYFINPVNVCVWDHGNSAIQKDIPGFRSPKYRCFYNTSKAEALAITSEGLSSLHNKDWMTVISKESVERIGRVTTFFPLEENRFVFIYPERKGVELALLGKDGKLTGEFLFNEEEINFAFSDRDQNYWFCTPDRGVYCVTYESRNHYHIRLPGADEPVRISSVGENELAIGTRNGSLYSLNVSTFEYTLLYGNPETRTLEHVESDMNGNVWFGGDEGLFRWNRLSNTTDQVRIFDRVYDIKDMIIDENNKLYVAIINGILTADLNERNVQLDWVNHVPKNRVYAICSETQDRLWFENNDRLYFADSVGLNEISAFGNLSRGRISCIAEAGSGYIMVATMGSGIIFLKGDQITGQLSRQQGLPSDECRQLKACGYVYYAITSSGITSFQLKEGVPFNIRNFSRVDGVPPGRIFDVWGNDEYLFLLSGTGVHRLKLNQVQQHSSPPLVHLLGFFSEGKDLLHNNSFEVGYQRNLRVEFIGITFSYAEEMHYEYKLDNAINWTPTNNRSLELNMLSWGDHQLEIRARKYNSDWSSPAILQFTVTPPFYGTWWFISIFAVIVLGIIFWLFRYLARRKYRQQLARLEQEQLVLMERNRISTDLHDDLGAELSNIVILSRIARSKMGREEPALDPVHKIDVAANEIINKMSGIIWSLNPANDSLENLVDYLRKYAQEFLEMHSLDGEVVVTGIASKIEMKGMTRRNVFLIFKEVLHNVHKHSGAKTVSVGIELNDHKVQLLVQDDGKGFLENQTPGYGLGMKSMKRRASEIGGKLTIDSISGTGTKVELEFPV